MYIMHRWKENDFDAAVGVAVAVVVVLLTMAIGIRPVLVKIRRRGNVPRSGVLKTTTNPAHAKFDIIAVHGLGADPVHTWSHAIPADSVDRTQEPEPTDQGVANRSTRINLLKDLLPKDFPEARILSFEYNSRWLTDAPIKTTEEIGKNLLEEIKANRPQRRLPIIFIGHSLGGIVIKQALCRNDSQKIINDTSGIIFLGTPHHGSNGSNYGAIIAHLTCLLGSDLTMLMSLGRHAKQLSNLADEFQSCLEENKHKQSTLRVISFYETKKTYILGWLPIGQVVLRDSATVHASNNHPIDTDHSGLNKFAGPEDPPYVLLTRIIEDLKTPSQLEKADKLLQSKHYDGDRLSIERLSGRKLSMNQCYINLAIVEQIYIDNHRNKEDSTGSKDSLFARQKVETPNKTVQVELPNLFDTRETNGEFINPRRILIRGQAGVGKTTLCKKIVHDFMHDKQTALYHSWTKLFNRLLWVPLRNLKSRSRTGYNLQDLFYDEYFSQEHDGSEFAGELWRDIGCDKKTLFVLDGLDEISHRLNDDDEMFPFLVELLSQPNVIITSRPHTNLPARVKDLDLELETIGFYPEQVNAYLEADPEIKERANEVQLFLRDHRLLECLVRIPILLDALCYAWEDFHSGTAPDTMTCIYEAIMPKLWKKDTVRLKRREGYQVKSARPPEILRIVEADINLLGCIAFSGLYNNIIDFTPAHRDDIVEQLPSQLQSSDMLDDTLAKISFLRTSDPSSKPEDRNYHFIHLTFQEYFAAKYFVQKWVKDQPLECLFNKQQNRNSDRLMNPATFLQQQKYSARYDVFWRFVAGIIATKDNGNIQHFFKEIEEEPLDLLGLGHQRLVMHCLSEVPRDRELPCRADLERVLSEWLLFEYEFRGSAHLAKEREFPEEALDLAIDKASYKMKKKILEAVSGRALIPPSILELGASWLGCEDPDSRSIAIHVLGKQSTLPVEILKAIDAQLDNESMDVRQAVAAQLDNENESDRRAAIIALGKQPDLPGETLQDITKQLNNKDKSVRRAAIIALGKQPDLPGETLQAIAEQLDNKDESVRRAAIIALGKQPDLPGETLQDITKQLNNKDKSVRRAAIIALGKQPALPVEVLQDIAEQLEDQVWEVQRAAETTLRRRRDFYHVILGGPRAVSLFKVLLKLNFQEQLSWYIEDGDSCVNMAEDIRKVSISDPRRYVEAIVNARPANYPSIRSQ